MLFRSDLAADPSGRAVRMGCGGAPLYGRDTFFGYGTVRQQPDDRLLVEIWDQSDDHRVDQWSVSPSGR